jgi:hypothetical protein
VRRLFDLAYLRQLVETAPSAAAVRQELTGNAPLNDNASPGPLHAVAHIHTAAAYLEQHGA